MANAHIFLLMLIDRTKNPDKRHSWTIESVEAASKPCFGFKSAFGRYLRCDSGDHFTRMCNGSVIANSKACSDERTCWVFTTDPSDVCGVKAMRMNDITMNNRNSKCA